MAIILGSSSPRRAEILSFFAIPFRQEASHFDEDLVPYNVNIKVYAEELAQEKAKVLTKIYPHDCIITADTVVSIEGHILGKPKDENEMKETLSMLSGRWHSVITGICVASNGHLFVGSEETRVLFNTLTPYEIHCYIKSHTLIDKAGSYAIQRSGSIIVNKIEGCYYNVMGLPINTMRILLEKAGINLWHHLQPF